MTTTSPTALLLQPTRRYDEMDDLGATSARDRRSMTLRVSEDHIVFRIQTEYDTAVFHCGPEQLQAITEFASSVFQEPDSTPCPECHGFGWRSAYNGLNAYSTTCPHCDGTGVQP